jgi:hypothetical protein
MNDVIDIIRVVVGIVKVIIKPRPTCDLAPPPVCPEAGGAGAEARDQARRGRGRPDRALPGLGDGEGTEDGDLHREDREGAGRGRARNATRAAGRGTKPTPNGTSQRAGAR